MADIFIAKRVIDYVGLGVRGVPESQFRLLKELMPNLSLMQGMGADGAKLLSVDNQGFLQVTLTPGGAVSQVRVSNGSGGTVADPIGLNSVLGITAGALPVYVPLDTGNGTAFLGKQASATNLAAQSGLGTALAAPPGQWSQFADPGVGVAASTSRVAGGAGVRHICTGFTFAFSSSVALGAVSTMVLGVRDGASGAGTFLWRMKFSLPAAIIAPFTVALSGLALVGTAATAMTAEYDVANANIFETVSIAGYDAS